VPFTNGGISFYLRPAAKGYNYWIYICPKDCPFSAKQAAKTLRDSADRGVTPWGYIKLSPEPMVDQLTDDLLRDEMGMASAELLEYVKYILHINIQAAAQREELKQSIKNSKQYYETTD
jgi:hypothetical protein